MVFNLACITSLLYVGYCMCRPIIRYKIDYTKYNRYWNIFLSGYSGITTYNVYYLLKDTSLGTLCLKDDTIISNNVWIFLFVLSKFIELGDTFFLIQRGKRLSFLHCYHHASVLLFTAHAWDVKNVYGVYFTGMNAFIHSIMYLYYTHPVKLFSIYITILQCLQMVFGLFFCVYGRMYCPLYPTSFMMGMLMYLSYFVLFAKYFYKRYIM